MLQPHLPQQALRWNYGFNTARYSEQWTTRLIIWSADFDDLRVFSLAMQNKQALSVCLITRSQENRLKLVKTGKTAIYSSLGNGNLPKRTSCDNMWLHVTRKACDRKRMWQEKHQRNTTEDIKENNCQVQGTERKF